MPLAAALREAAEAHAETVTTVKTGIVGLIGTMGGGLTSLAMADEVLRFLTLLVGLAIGLVSLWRLLRKGRNNRPNKRP